MANTRINKKAQDQDCATYDMAAAELDSIEFAERMGWAPGGRTQRTAEQEVQFEAEFKKNDASNTREQNLMHVAKATARKMVGIGDSMGMDMIAYNNLSSNKQRESLSLSTPPNPW